LFFFSAEIEWTISAKLKDLRVNTLLPFQFQGHGIPSPPTVKISNLVLPLHFNAKLYISKQRPETTIARIVIPTALILTSSSRPVHSEAEQMQPASGKEENCAATVV